MRKLSPRIWKETKPCGKVGGAEQNASHANIHVKTRGCGNKYFLYLDKETL